MKKTLSQVVTLLVAFLCIGTQQVGSLMASKQGQEFQAPPPIKKTTLPGSGSIQIQRQGGQNSIQGTVSTTRGDTSFFGGGWKAGSNQGVFGGINRRWKEEVRHLVLEELGLL